MMHVFQDVLQKLYQIIFSITNQTVGADELFPMTVLLLIHSDVPELMRYMNFLHLFLSSEEKMGETGYCLITFEAAITHLLQM